MTAVWVALLGAAGSLSRWLLAGAVQKVAGPKFPAGTLVVNLLGSAAIGAVMGVFAARGELESRARIAITGGFLGGFTTYSAFAYDTWAYLERGAWWWAALNALVTLGGCLVACAGGAALARLALSPG